MEELVALAFKYNVAVVPIGGGTNVTGAVDCKRDEQRMIVSLDTSQMVTPFLTPSVGCFHFLLLCLKKFSV